MCKESALSVKKAGNLSDNDFMEVVDMTVTAFDGDPAFEFVFASSKHLRKFLCVCLKFFYRSGQMYLCVNDAGELCGVSCWVDRGGEEVSRPNMRKYGILGEFRRTMLSMPPRSFCRVTRLGALTDKKHIKEPHGYLFLIASFQKGAGGTLLNDYIAAHPATLLYLENSDIDKNTPFYMKHGFTPLPEVKCGSISILPMIRQPGVVPG